MKLSKAVKPLSYVKAHASELIRDMNTNDSGPVVITQNGEATAVLQGIKEYEAFQESLALLKILAAGSKEARDGETVSAGEGFAQVRENVGRTAK